MFSSYEKAMELVFRPVDEKTSKQRLEMAEQLVALLDRALHHAEFSIITGPALTEEKEFNHFIRFNRLSALSARSMIENECNLREHEGFIVEFLGGNCDETTLGAMHYQRRSQDVIEGLAHLMRQAQAPYFSLKKKVTENLPPEEKERFSRSYTDFGRELHHPSDQKAGK